MKTTPPLVSRMHHAAYTTRDLEATRRFYEDVIGLPLEAAWCERDEIFGAEREFCHALFGLGDGSALAFFQFADPEDQALFDPTMPFTPFHHVALRVDAAAQRDLEHRLHEAGFREPQTRAVEHGYCRSVYVVDPNGLLLEFTRDHTNVAEINGTRKASAHTDLQRWLAGDRQSNNTYRQVNALVSSSVRFLLLAFVTIASTQLSACTLESDDAVWASEARQSLFRSDDEPDTDQRAGARAKGHEQTFVYTGSITDAVEFWRPHPTGNGRSCATCHRPEDNFALTPKTVEARWQLLQARRREDPSADDPLFRSIDADDFAGDFTTLRTRALMRVTLTLPDNVEIADKPDATTVSVFRSVPTVLNTAFAAPFQSDGRRATLEEQAHHAMLEHSQVRRQPSQQSLIRIANFQRQLFSSKRASQLAEALADESNNERPSEITGTKLEQQGLTTFARFCASCHGGPTLSVNADVRFLPLAARGPRPDGPQEFVNIFVQTPRPPPPFAPAPVPRSPGGERSEPARLLPAINIPGQVVHFDAARQHLVTVDYLYSEQAGTSWQACSA